MAFPTRVGFRSNVNWGGGGTTTLPTIGASWATTAGNTIVVCVGADAGAVVGVSDSAGNTYVAAAAYTDSTGYREAIWYANNISAHASTVVTVTWSVPVQYRGIVAIEYTGILV